MSREVTVAGITLGLKSRQNEVRIRNAVDLQHFVAHDLRSMSSEKAGEFMDELESKCIRVLCSSSEIHERKGGVLAMSKFSPCNNFRYKSTFHSEISYDLLLWSNPRRNEFPSSSVTSLCAFHRFEPLTTYFFLWNVGRKNTIPLHAPWRGRLFETWCGAKMKGHDNEV